MVFTDTMKTVWGSLADKGLSPCGAAGLMGNLYAESGINPIVLERLCIQRYKEQGITWTNESYTAAVDSGSVSRQEFVSPMRKHYGYGLAQWTTENRKAGLYDFCKRRNASIGDLAAQLDYLYFELGTSFLGVLQALLGAVSVQDASDVVLEKFERPSGWESQKAIRAKYGMEIYDHFLDATKMAAREGGGMAVTERDIVICGHGSGKPSTKVMQTYLEQRWQSLATNGKHRGLVAVRRLKALTDADRVRFHDLYRDIIGRNIYNQNLREYCYKRYADGNYYSDCSSSGVLTFKQLGYAFPWTLNTAGIYQSDLFETVPVQMANGHVMNPGILKVGDCLLFVGNDPSRPLQIGHVEYVYQMPEGSGGDPDPKPEYPRWVQAGGEWYYRVAEGQNAHGWMTIAESGNPDAKHWYYFDPGTGKMAAGWFQVGGKWFYAEPLGYPLAGALYHEADTRDGSLEIWTL